MLSRTLSLSIPNLNLKEPLTQQNWPVNTGAVTHVYTTVFSFTTGGYVASYAVVNTAPYGPNLDAFFTCSYGCPYDHPVPTCQTHRTASQAVLARKNNRHAAAPVPVMHRSKPSLAT